MTRPARVHPMNPITGMCGSATTAIRSRAAGQHVHQARGREGVDHRLPEWVDS
jgi:hypothetical protein